MKEKQKFNYQGKVVFFDNDQGYGTILREDGNHFLFTYEALPIENGDFKVPEIGQKVEFQLVKNDLDIIAVNIKFME